MPIFQIDKKNKRAALLEKRKLSELGFGERNDLQEWIANNPKILLEDLLIIQKEYDKFLGTNERLDLLAVDKDGKLVIIENKLDDSGKDVVVQALKYASYCSEFTKKDILRIFQDYLDRNKDKTESQKILLDFLEDKDLDEVCLNNLQGRQRIILVASKFRREVTSLVLWLQKYDIDIKCIQVTPFKNNEDICLNVEQILPPDNNTDEYEVYIKQQDEIREKRTNDVKRDKICREFWEKALPVITKKNQFLENIRPVRDFLNKASGVSNITFEITVLTTGIAIKMIFSSRIKETNKEIFKKFYAEKEKYQRELGEPTLEW